MSRKSGFSTAPSRERPRIQRELPHRRKTLRGRRGRLTGVVLGGPRWTDAHVDRRSAHDARIAAGRRATKPGIYVVAVAGVSGRARTGASRIISAMPAARNAITAADTNALEYEPVHSKIQPAPAAPSAEPTW